MTGGLKKYHRLKSAGIRCVEEWNAPGKTNYEKLLDSWPISKGLPLQYQLTVDSKIHSASINGVPAYMLCFSGHWVLISKWKEHKPLCHVPFNEKEQITDSKYNK